MSPQAAAAVFPPQALTALGKVCDLAPLPALDDLTTARAREILAEVEVLVTGWGCPPLDAGVLASAPHLKAVVHAAGSVRGHVTDACWERGIEVSSAAAANALPVAEYTLGMILLYGKQVLERARAFRNTRRRDDWLSLPRTVGNYRSTVGIVSASLVGRRVIELLRPFDLEVLLYDPYVSEADAAELGARWVDLPTLFARSDLVSIHTPLLPATRGLVGRALLDAMRPGATLINTSRGAVVDQEALTDVVRAGRIRAVLDVTDPEVLPPGHPLWDCPNVLITPHLAGSQGNEWERLAETAVAEVARWAAGDGFAHPVRRERLAFLA
ncbi:MULTISPECIES: hydroxyacid dehydrogenase [Streptomyces]|uniref:Hydroxyacid dehydrogenase n=1 Tax=Streptomyces thermoviolaceus subsp. thermoviolaceus TaxID=66860 RepID=A0ABX0Z2A7_STRTL|nr:MULTISPECIES: hydroxyacid dehydrogenase [Streptomyces]MCM3266735.1 hydroxyacid dehydrogenase [Streptomyces thermoviolaceus]NJP17330.1 hydroxyacid dehydrogenase [Streptomyces thermoviolaceus subsp. thermoviolaceus]RSR98317.1 hydroxyacid dehydrogenase [Streptomyces sp. WAC00469]WTD50622.1 hydroxyacid dehydrogenase [Streptomyces thermoviolaceus]GGV76142.1 2-hydroxyacid dehydrogenase [Streptomyces thermoviolaceus subsp. apingens]